MGRRAKRLELHCLPFASLEQGSSCAHKPIRQGSTKAMTVRLHRGDLPDLSRYTGSVALDTETMGLNPHRDRLCVVQLSTGDGSADLVQISAGQTRAPNLERLLTDPAVTKLFHYARFDVAILQKTFGVVT